MESRFEHYFQLIDSDDLDEVIEVIDNCEKHHCLFYIYDIGISFSGKQREEARKIAEVLEEGGAKVFFDEFNKADLIGRDLVDEFYTVFSRECRYVLILVSKDYLEGIWTSHEYAAAKERVLKERGAGYILPIQVDDDAFLPGLPRTIAYLPLDNNPIAVGKTILDKIFLRVKRYSLFGENGE